MSVVFQVGLVIFGFLVFFILGFEAEYYDFTIHSYDHMCKAISKRPIRIVEEMSADDGSIYYYIQFRTPITMRWKNELTNPGIDFWCIPTYKTKEEARQRVIEICKRANSGRVVKLGCYMVQG